MENVTVDPEQAKQERQEDRNSGHPFFEPQKASQKLGDMITRQATPDTFEEKREAEEGIEDESKGQDAEASNEEESAEAEGSEEEQVEDTDEASEEQEQEAEETEDQSPEVSESLANQLSEAYPDKDFEDAEQVTQTIESLIEDSGNLKAEREANKKVYDLFENSPEMVEMARKMDEGNSFPVALAATIDVQELIDEVKEHDPEEYKEMMKAQAQREVKAEQEAKEIKDFEEEFKQNQQDSQENIDAFQEEHSLDDKAAEDFLDTVNNHFSDIVNGKVTPAFLNLMHKALNYDVDIEKAKEEGKVAGKNEKINEKKHEKIGDGLPNISNGQSRKPKEASNGKRAIANIVSGSRSTFN